MYMKKREKGGSHIYKRRVKVYAWPTAAVRETE